jgi:hypothetical protein
MNAPGPPKQKRAPVKSALQKLTRKATLTTHVGQSNCAAMSWWRVSPGVCRFQTTLPRFARKLSQRSGARLVAWSVGRGYLRVYEERIQPCRAHSLVRRYLAPTNRTFCAAVDPSVRSKAGGRPEIAGGLS